MTQRLTNVLRQLWPHQSRQQFYARLGIAFAVFAPLCVVFIWLAQEIRDNETLGFDRSLLYDVHHASSPTVDTIVKLLTNLGGFAVVPFVTLAIAAWLWRQQRQLHALIILTCVGGAAVINYVLKLMFERSRPELWQRIVSENSFSFPSGHAMASAALAASVVGLLWYTKWRIASMVGGAVYGFLIGFTRLYLGVHYPTDILAGWVVSVAWVTLVFALFYTAPGHGRLADPTDAAAKTDV